MREMPSLETLLIDDRRPHRCPGLPPTLSDETPIRIRRALWIGSMLPAFGTCSSRMVEGGSPGAAHTGTTRYVRQPQMMIRLRSRGEGGGKGGVGHPVPPWTQGFRAGVSVLLPVNLSLPTPVEIRSCALKSVTLYA